MRPFETPDNFNSVHRPCDRRAMRQVLAVACVLSGILTTIFLISSPFEYGNPAKKPIAWVTGLFFLATLFSIWAVVPATRIERSKRSLVWLIVMFGLSFRLLFLFSSPILEIDLYRYMWDGKVANIGVSPYKYSPSQVLHDELGIEDADHNRVVALSGSTETLNTILSRVHFQEYSTIYPPVSQSIFAFSMWLVPDQASINAHELSIKTALVAFDLGTMFLVLLLLLRTRRHPGWLIIYAWNPLVIKEIANSGHVDSIAVFFMMAAIFTVICLLDSQRRRGRETRWLDQKIRRSFLVSVAAIVLALGTGAKLFPILLLPALLFAIFRQNWRDSILFGGMFFAVLAVVIWPMAVESIDVRNLAGGSNLAKIPNHSDRSIETARHLKKKEGLSGFLTHWRMNDVVFSAIYHNAKPDADKNLDQPWYVFVPNNARRTWNQWLLRFGGVGNNPAFLTARILTTIMFMAAYLAIIFRIRKSADPRSLLNNCFLIIATFFFLQPTQNPWYWLWAIPLACFADNRGWLMVPAFLFCYYLRFWFKSLTGEFCLGSFCYSGTGLFDHCIVWFEFGAIFAVIIGFRISKCRRTSVRNPQV